MNPAPNTANGWLPADTAPRDGSWFLVLETGGYMLWSPYEFASWQTVEWQKFSERGFESGAKSYFGGTDTSEEIDFDWWRPLPELPA